MNYQRQQLMEMRKHFAEIREAYSNELKRLPQGSLWCSANRGRQQYYMIETRNGIQTRRGINKEPEMINRLARRKFIEDTIDGIDKNIAVLDRALTEFRDLDPQVIIDSMTKAYKTLSRDCFFQQKQSHNEGSKSRGGQTRNDQKKDGKNRNCKNQDGQNANNKTQSGRNPNCLPDESGELYRSPDEIFYTEEELAQARYERHTAWAEAPYVKSTYRPEDLIETTSKGEHMRSKSEVLMAEAFYKYRIPFRYEDATDYPWLDLVPDFTFRGYDRKLFYLEYCGMMDNEEYVRNYLRKREKYEENGICAWDNIIYIFEQGNRINMEMVEEIIKNQILPRL